MKKPILIGNWKNKPGSLGEARSILIGLRKKSAVFKKLDTYIAPPEVYYESVSERVKGFAHLASQGLPRVEKGTYTGVISLEVLRNFGVRLAILGHSEERALGETDALVAKKVQIALKSGIKPLVCIGEREHDTDGNHLEFIRRQMKTSLEGVKKKEIAEIMIAYEPVWAIGKRAKDAITPEGLTEMVIFIRRILTDMYGRDIAEKIPILYGGSVEPRNAEILYKDTGVRGFLVGHESLNHKEFEQIAESLI